MDVPRSRGAKRPAENTGQLASPRRAGPANAWRRLLRRAAATAILTYLVICIVIASLQARLIYFPSKDYWGTPTDLGLPFADLSLITDDGITIAAWHVPHPHDSGTVLFCHANAGNMGDRLYSVKAFHDLGYSVLIFDYRGYGRSQGKPTEEGTYRDAQAAWRYLVETRGTPPERIVLFGRSLGGAVAIDLAARRKPGALVVESSFTNLVDVGKRHYPLLPVGLLCRYRYDSIKKVPNITCPKLFIHADDDELVPLANGRRLFDAAAQPKHFIQTPGGHNDGGFEHSQAYTDMLKRWLDESLTPPPPRS